VKQLTVTRQKTVLAPGSVWSLRRREKSLFLLGN